MIGQYYTCAVTERKKQLNVRYIPTKFRFGITRQRRYRARRYTNGRYKDGNLHVINTLYGRFFSFRRYKCPFVIRASVIDAPNCS